MSDLCSLCKKLKEKKEMNFVFMGKNLGKQLAEGCDLCGFLFPRKLYNEIVLEELQKRKNEQREMKND